MGANALGPRKLRALSRATGLQLVKAWVWSHVEAGRWCVFDTADGRRGELDRRTGHWLIKSPPAAPPESPRDVTAYGRDDWRTVHCLDHPDCQA